MGNQKSQAKNDEVRVRKRDFFKMCMNKHQDVSEEGGHKNKSLTNYMNHKEIINRLIDQDMPLYSVKLIQYVLNYLTIQESLNLKLVSKKLKFVVEMSSNIYANYLSSLYIRNIHVSNFIEYGSDTRFQNVYKEQLLKIELNQDENWFRIYQDYKKSILQFRELKLQFPLNLTDLIVNSIVSPFLPIAILTDDKLKQSTTSWFQLYMAQNEVNSNLQSTVQLSDIYEKLYIDCLGQYSIQNLQHTQLLLEIKWVIVDNFIKDPSTIHKQVPLMFQLVAQILHMIYLRCLFSRNVLLIIKNDKIQAQLLNFYVILWRSFMGTIWHLNIYFEELFQYVDKLFNTFYKTSLPSYNFITIAGRIWTQIVLKGQNDGNIFQDPIENGIISSFSLLLNEKRYQLLEFFIKDQEEQRMSTQFTSQLFKDQYFHYISSAINCLLGHLSSSLLDVSLHEQSINWIGHSKLSVGSPYAQLLDHLVKDSHTIYQKASTLFGIDQKTFQEYIIADTKFLQEVINKWTVQIILEPIGLGYLYDKVKINLRQLVINLNTNQSLQEDQVIEQESMILPQNQQFISVNHEDHLESIQIQPQPQTDILELMVLQIVKEEKIIKEEPNKSIINNKYVQSIVTEETAFASKFRELSKYSISVKSSQVTQWTSQYSQQQQLSHYQSQNEQTIVKQLCSNLNNTPWNQHLENLRQIDLENQKIVEKRNCEVEWRNKVRNINLNIEDQVAQVLDFSYIPHIEKIMQFFHQVEPQFLHQMSYIEIEQNDKQFIQE